MTDDLKPSGRSVRRRVLLLAAMLALAVVAWRLRSSGSPKVPPLELGWVQDVLGEQVSATDFLGALPAVVNVGPARAVDQLLAARALDSTPTIVDVSGIDAVRREALAARLVEAALEDGGAIATDATGVSVRSLAGTFDGAVRVEIDGGGFATLRKPIEEGGRAAR